MATQAYIPRILSWKDSKDKEQILEDTEILHSFDGPMVILGDPGMGKSWLLEKMIGVGKGSIFLKATSFLRQSIHRYDESTVLVIDGLDEVSAAKEGDPLDHVLSHLVKCGCPRFILSCRSAEWSSVRGSGYIKDEYRTAPRELHLKPLTEEDALNYLSHRVDRATAGDSVAKLKLLGLEEFYSNPLFLEFVRSILIKKGSVPESRSELYKKAVAQLRKETADRDSSPLTDLSEDRALDAAGCTMAVFLLGGFDGLSKGHGIEDRILSVVELSDYIPVDDLKTVLGSNLFKSDSSAKGVFLPQHRTIAEYLGARWLAKFTQASNFGTRNAYRLQSALVTFGGVPSSLRGLNAWIPVFCHGKLGTISLQQDPYGVLRFGDGDSLSVTQAKVLIPELRELAIKDPGFRNHWEDTLFLKGLIHEENIGDIERILQSKEEPYGLRMLLWEGILSLGKDTPPISGLENIGLDADRSIGERLRAIQSLNFQYGEGFEWEGLVEKILARGDGESSRLALLAFDKVGYRLFSVEQICRTVVSHFDIRNAEGGDDDRHAIGELYALERRLPLECLGEFLDLLSDIILPLRNPKRYWETSHHEGWEQVIRLINHLVLRYLKKHQESVEPERLLKWLKAGIGDHSYSRTEEETLRGILAEDDRLRQSVQRLVLSDQQDTESITDRSFFLTELSQGLRITQQDARLYLNEIVARLDKSEAPFWYYMADILRQSDGYISKDDQTLARPYARLDSEMLRFLRTKPKKRKLSESQKKWRRREQQSTRNRLRRIAKMRADFDLHLDEVRDGELGWTLRPAKAYLGRCSDLDRKASPEDRLAELLGEEIGAVALEGFETVLHRGDLPMPITVSQGYAESRVWNYVYPMMAGLGYRFRSGRGFVGVPIAVISASLIAVERELNYSELGFDGLGKSLRAELKKDKPVYEQHLRDKFEPRIKAGCQYIEGIYEFTRSGENQPMASFLCIQWLEQFGEMAMEVERELALCVARCLNTELEVRLIGILESKLKDVAEGSERAIFWRSLQFVFKPDEAIPHIPEPNEKARGWLWNLVLHGDRYSEEESFISNFDIEQLEWLVERYRCVWPATPHPRGVSSGSRNEWNATDLIQGLIYRIASIPRNEACQALARLRAGPEDGYSEVIQVAIAKHSKLLLETHYRPVSLTALKSVLSDGPPTTAADVLSILVYEFEDLQKRIRGDAVNSVNGFYNDHGIPKEENDCRDEMLKLLNLPDGITHSPEVAMPQGNRADVGFIFGVVSIPLEAKGQWHPKVWSAASSQLDALYAKDYRADAKGVYIVFWFGEGAPEGRKIKNPPPRIAKPSTSDEMRRSLVDLIPAHRRSDLEVVVLDLTRPE